ncbi:tetratricopeptide repeat protein [Polynucleobacter paneuropaeus]|nr:tetratricopeptide repeat protein [Polynucleobacter paneuropaeus]MBT8554460.1 tetratricopeptide repeat protein [Polynucleobacter paneuropaeus]
MILAGCTGISGGRSNVASSFGSSTADQKISPPKQNVTHELVKQGIEYLREGDYERAQKVFSAAVKVSPNSSALHLLNGITYHLEYLNNTPDSKELAETAYSLAASMDKSDTLPIVQLGRLHIDAAEYSKASKDFIAAYSISPSNQDALFGLMQSSLLQKDFKTALWAGESLKALNTTDADKLRLMVLTYAAVGKSTEANETLSAYVRINADHPKEIAQLKQQLSYISSQLNSLKLSNVDADKTPASLGPTNIESGKMVKVADRAGASGARGGAANNSGLGSNNANNNSGSNSNSSSTRGSSSRSSGTGAAAISNYQNNQDSSDDSSTGSSGSSGSSGSTGTSAGASQNATSPMSSGGGGGGTYSAVFSMSNQQQRWFDCDTKPGLGKAPGGSYGVPVGGTSGDQTLYLEPLPSPCKGGKPPQMATVDAVLIRTVDTQSSSYGINLLSGLTAFAGAQSFRSTGSSGGVSVSGVVQNSVFGVGTATSAAINSVSGLVSYSLNIANSTTSNSQVIARPTLTALDRIPSTFYSGGVITAGLNGGGVSGAQVTNIPTGVSLSITPTFVDDDTMMLAVKVSRSYVSGTIAQGGFNAGISTEQHAVTANVRVKYGETLILDGLASRQINGTQDGVPVLQDIPIIQYLFNQKTNMQYSENVIVMVTPRRIQSNEEAMKRASANAKDENLTPKERSVYKALNLYQQLASTDTNLDNALLALDQDSSYFRSFKSAALSAPLDSWVSEPAINKFFNDAANLMYFTR